MPRRLLTVALALALGVGSAPVSANEVLFWLLEQYLEALRRNAGIPGLAVALVGEEGLLWERGFGLQDVENAVAVRPDTPFHTDGLGQILTASLVLRCVEEGRLALDDPVGRFDPGSPDAAATLRDVLTHTSNGPNGPVFAYRPQRFGSLEAALAACTGRSFRETLAEWFDRLGMRDSVPGADAASLAAPAGPFDQATATRYGTILQRLAVSYVAARGARPVRSEHPARSVSPSSGVISTVRDLARLDLALRKGVIVRAEALAAAWQPRLTASGVPLPHGLGWFVQSYRGELVVWQFGVADGASSSLIVTVPRRSLTFIVLANSDGVVIPFPLTAGDVTASPVGRLLLGMFVG